MPASATMLRQPMPAMARPDKPFFDSGDGGVVLMKERKHEKPNPVHADLALPEHDSEQGDVRGCDSLDAGSLTERGGADL